MNRMKPMFVLKDGIDTLPAAIGRLLELHDSGKPVTVEMDAEITALLKMLQNLADNLKQITDVIM